jgi:hypothetical protein
MQQSIDSAANEVIKPHLIKNETQNNATFLNSKISVEGEKLSEKAIPVHNYMLKAT